MILPGSTVKVIDENSIYRGYVGCVQRIQGKKAAVLMDSHTPWDKMITFCLLYTSPSPRDLLKSRMPSSA